MNRIRSVSTATDNNAVNAATIIIAAQNRLHRHACDGYDLTIRSGTEPAYLGQHQSMDPIIKAIQTHVRLFNGACGQSTATATEHGVRLDYPDANSVEFEVHRRECCGHVTEYGESRFQNSASIDGTTTVSMERLDVHDDQGNVVEAEWNVWVMADLAGLEAGIHPQDIPAVVEALKGLHACWLAETGSAAA